MAGYHGFYHNVSMLEQIERVIKRWRWGNNCCRGCSRSLVNLTLVVMLPLLLVLDLDIVDASVPDNKKFFS